MLERGCQPAEGEEARPEQGPPALSSSWEAVWEEPAHREGAAGRGLLSFLLLATPGDRPGTCRVFCIARAGDRSWEPET